MEDRCKSLVVHFINLPIDFNFAFPTRIIVAIERLESVEGQLLLYEALIVVDKMFGVLGIELVLEHFDLFVQGVQLATEARRLVLIES